MGPIFPKDGRIPVPGTEAHPAPAGWLQRQALSFLRTAILDTACGYASYTLMPAEVEVLTVEFKINFMAPAIGEKMIARGRVTRAGRTLTVCAGDAFAVKGGKERLIAILQATMMTVRQNSDSG